MTEKNNFKTDKDFWQAAAVLTGTTIGAGMFGIPYVISKIGFWPGVFYLLFLGALTLVLNLIYGEVVLRTSGDHQIGGYVKKYLGEERPLVRTVSTISFFISAYGALLAYLIKIGEFVFLIFGFGSPVVYSLIFFCLAVVVVGMGLKAVSSFEFFLVVLLIGMVFFLFFSGVFKIQPRNLSLVNLSYFFFPYGVIFFAFAGNSVIPEMEEVLRKKHHLLKKAIIIGTIVPLVIYLLFSLLVVGICGSSTSDDAVKCLQPFFSSFLVKFGAFLGALTMGTSFFALGYVLREVWLRDFSFDKKGAVLLASLPPLILFLLGVRRFIRVIEISGAVSGGLTGVFILFLFSRAKEKGERKPAYALDLPKFVLAFLYVILFLGMLSPFLGKK